MEVVYPSNSSPESTGRSVGRTGCAIPRPKFHEMQVSQTSQSVRSFHTRNRLELIAGFEKKRCMTFWGESMIPNRALDRMCWDSRMMWLLARGGVSRDCVSQVVEVVSSIAVFIFWIVVHTSCWACDSAFFKRTRFAMRFWQKSVLPGLALRETKPFFRLPFRRFSSNDKWPQRNVALVKSLLQLPSIFHCITRLSWPVFHSLVPRNFL